MEKKIIKTYKDNGKTEILDFMQAIEILIDSGLFKSAIELIKALEANMIIQTPFSYYQIKE